MIKFKISAHSILTDEIKTLYRTQKQKGDEKVLTRLELKEKSKEQLRGKWGSAVCVGLILFGISFALGIVYQMVNIPLLPLIASVVVNPFLYYGFYKYFLDLSRDGAPQPGDLFSHSDILGKAIITNLLLVLLFAACMLLFIIPSIVLIIAMGANIRHLETVEVVFSRYGVLIILTILGAFVAYALVILLSYRYRLIYFVISDYPDLSPVAVLGKSKELMVGHKFDLFVLDLSFIGWSLLCLFTCGIGYLFLIPYIMATNANFYNCLNAKHDTDPFTIDAQYQN